MYSVSTGLDLENTKRWQKFDSLVDVIAHIKERDPKHRLDFRGPWTIWKQREGVAGLELVGIVFDGEFFVKSAIF